MRKQNILVMGNGVERIAMIALDLADEDEAIQLARRLAVHTGRAVAVRDADGQILDTIQATKRN
jgi:uncharacterized protein YggE